LNTISTTIQEPDFIINNEVNEPEITIYEKGYNNKKNDLQVILPNTISNKEEYTKFDDSTLFSFSVTGYKEPNTLKEAYFSFEKEYWKKAVENELNQILLYGTIYSIDKNTVIKKNKEPITAR
jgi:hypothetical protein